MIKLDNAAPDFFKETLYKLLTSKNIVGGITC